VIYSLIGTAKLNGLDPEAYLREVLAHRRASDQPNRGVASVASRRRKPKLAAPRGVSRKTPPAEAPSNGSRLLAAQTLVLPALEAFIADEGQVSIGDIGPVRGAAVASNPPTMLAALIRRPAETLPQLLMRLDAAVQFALDQDCVVDEINARPSRR